LTLFLLCVGFNLRLFSDAVDLLGGPTTAFIDWVTG
jgi:hypothetical protein